MKIYVNELSVEESKNITAYKIKNKYKPNADVMIVNGFPIREDMTLNDGDRISLIKKGEIPKENELENLLIARHTPNIHNKLKQGRVAILGLGGLGSNIAISLARIGVGSLFLIDYDVVEPSNLNRQQYFIEDIGKYKTEALTDIIKKINPFINIESKNMLVNKENMDVFEDVDIIIEAFDNPNCKAEISNYVLLNMKEKYLIASSGMAGYHDSNTINTKRVRDKFYVCGDFISEARFGEGLMAPRVSICANHMANIATKILIEDLNY